MSGYMYTERGFVEIDEKMPIFDYYFPPDGPTDSMLKSAQWDHEQRILNYLICRPAIAAPFPERGYKVGSLYECTCWGKHDDRCHIHGTPNFPGLHDAGIEPSGQGEEALGEQDFRDIQYEAASQFPEDWHENPWGSAQDINQRDRKSFIKGAQWGILHERQQTALLSRQLLRSEMKLKETIERLETYIKLCELTDTQRKEWSELSIKFKTEIQAKDEEIQRLRKVLEKFPEVIQQIDEALNPSPKTTKEDI